MASALKIKCPNPAQCKSAFTPNNLSSKLDAKEENDVNNEGARTARRHLLYNLENYILFVHLPLTNF